MYVHNLLRKSAIKMTSIYYYGMITLWLDMKPENLRPAAPLWSGTLPSMFDLGRLPFYPPHPHRTHRPRHDKQGWDGYCLNAWGGGHIAVQPIPNTYSTRAPMNLIRIIILNLIILIMLFDHQIWRGVCNLHLCKLVFSLTLLSKQEQSFCFVYS